MGKRHGKHTDTQNGSILFISGSLGTTGRENCTSLILMQDWMQVNWSTKKEESAFDLGREQERLSEEMSEVSWDLGPESTGCLQASAAVMQL